MSKRKRTIKKETSASKYFTSIVVAVISMAGFVIYSNTFDASFHFDDHFFLINNDLIKNLNEFMSTKYWTNVYLRPLSSLSFAIDYRIHEFDVTGYHIVNIAIHSFTAMVVYYLTCLILQKSIYSNSEDLKISRIVSLFVAIIFLSHPIQTQSVNYIVQRMTLMAAFFYLLSVYTYFKGRICHLSANYHSGMFYYLLTVLLFCLAMFSKQNAITIPLSLLLIEVLFIRKADGKVVAINLTVMSVVLFSVAMFVILAGYLPRETNDISREVYFATQLRVVFRYMKLLFLPFPLNFDPYVVLSESMLGFKEVISMAGHFGILSIGIAFYRKNKIITFGIFWFYITLLVESSVIPIRDVMFEHRVYLPSYGFIIILVTVLFSFLVKRTRIKNVVLIFILLSIIYGGISYRRNKVWMNEFTLWSDVKDHPPVKARVYRYLGVEYIRMRQFKEALKVLNQAIKLDPTRWEEHANKATIYKIQKDYKSVIHEMNICIRLEPKEDSFFIERANAYIKIGKIEQAKKDFDKALEISKKKKMK